MIKTKSILEGLLEDRAEKERLIKQLQKELQELDIEICKLCFNGE